MREIRTSGSVEGVVGNHDSYSDSGVALRAPSSAALRTSARCARLTLRPTYRTLGVLARSRAGSIEPAVKKVPAIL
jgi:hypothetical protein